MFARQPVGTALTAVLLVGSEDQQDIAGRWTIGSLPRIDQRDQLRDELLHVDGTAAPHEPVANLPGERGHRPVVSTRRHDVKMSVND